MTPFNLVLERDAAWMPNHTVAEGLAAHVGRRLRWAFEGDDAQGRPWWGCLSVDGLRAPQPELVFHAEHRPQQAAALPMTGRG